MTFPTKLSPYVVHANHLKSKGGARIDLKSIMQLGNKLIDAGLGVSTKESHAMNYEDVDIEDEAIHAKVSSKSYSTCKKHVRKGRKKHAHFLVSRLCLTDIERKVWGT